MNLSCGYTNSQGQQNCKQSIWEGSPKRFCIFHDSSPQKPQNELEDQLSFKIMGGDCCFEGYIFPHSVNFRGFVFKEFANFENCQFLGKETSFYKAQFQKGAIFNHTTFKGFRILFSKAQFSGDFVLFNNCAFDGAEVLFVETAFLAKHLSFDASLFQGRLINFSQSQFKGSVFFTKTKWEADQVLWNKIQANSPQFSCAYSSFTCKEFRFCESVLQADQIDFSNGNWKSDFCYWENNLFSAREILFTHSYFECRVLSFVQNSWEFDQLSFIRASFHCRESIFSDFTLKRGNADFSEVNFQSKSLKFYPLSLENSATHFTRAEFSGDEKVIFLLNPHRNDISFQEVFFHGGITKLKGDLHRASFIDTSLDNVDFNDADWDKLQSRWICRDELDARQANDKVRYQKAQDVCRNIKQCYESFGSYETAGDFYYGEMECRRKLSARKNWGGLQFMRLTCGYGERPVRVIAASLFVVFICAFFYLLGGVHTPQGNIHRELALDLSQSIETLIEFFQCVYFSIVTFIALGGDYLPIGWSRVLWAIEGFGGVFFISMFVLTIGRKMNR